VIYIIHTCELGRMGTTISEPTKEQLKWALEHKFLCNVTTPLVKPKPIKFARPVTMVKPRPKSVVPKKVQTKPRGRPPGHSKRVEPKKE